MMISSRHPSVRNYLVKFALKASINQRNHTYTHTHANPSLIRKQQHSKEFHHNFAENY